MKECENCGQSSTYFYAPSLVWVARCDRLGSAVTIREGSEDEENAGDYPDWDLDLGRDNPYCIRSEGGHETVKTNLRTKEGCL